MDRDARIRRLPLALAIGLRLHEAGAADSLIATGLGIEPEGVTPMIELARAKLSRLEEDELTHPGTMNPANPGPSTSADVAPA